MTANVIGKAIRRKEDPALIQGKGLYTDDMKMAGMLHAAFVRSPFGKARILGIDASRATEIAGVHAVYTAEDVRQLGPLLAQVAIGALRPLLADGIVNHVGEAVAMVVATDRYIAQDAVDAVDVDYEPLEAVVDLEDAASDRAIANDTNESNVIHVWEVGDADAVAAARGTDGAVEVSVKMTNQRLIPTAIEPRSALADYNSGYGNMTLYSSSQIPHAVAGALGKTFGLSSNNVRVIAPEVGGGFGAKLNYYSEEALVTFASRELGSPVKWTETRREASVATIHGRGWVGTATIIGTGDGKILAYELDAISDMGAYTQNFTVAIPLLGQYVAPGQYDIPIHWKVRCVATNAPTTDAYRGAGRPEAIFYLERVIDAFARQIGMDPADVRKRNFFEEFPASTAAGMLMDSGDYGANLDRLLELADYQGLRQKQEEARTQGRTIGIGLSTYVEVCGFGPSALAEGGFSWASYGLPAAFNGSGLVRVNPDGTATVMIGTGPSGQGHETTWAQIVSDALGIAVEDIQVRHGDTRDSPMGIGTFGSRSLAVDGSATSQAAAKVREKAARVAAHMMEASPDDIEFADGGAHVAGSPDKTVTWAEIAEVSYQPHRLPDGMEGGMEANAVFSPANATWPFGSHLAVVEVDTTTGDVTLLEYFAMDDCGNVINPMIVDGQVHGGLAQGISQALFEHAIFDEDGNLLTGSLLDYPIPTASDLPSFKLGRTTTPTDVNPMGVKGIGEAGTIGSAQTVVNAVIDAVAHLGVSHIDMPLRPKRVWQAIHGNGA